MYPLLVHGQSEPCPQPRLAGRREGSNPQDGQSNAKTQRQRARGQDMLPRRNLYLGSLCGHGKNLAGTACPTPTERATLEPKVSDNHIGTKARKAPLWWHADLCQDHKHTRSDEDQKTTTLGGILAEEIHKTPGKRLAGDDSNATARPLPGPRQDPCRGHPQCHYQACASQPLLSRRLCGDVRPLH